MTILKKIIINILFILLYFSIIIIPLLNLTAFIIMLNLSKDERENGTIIVWWLSWIVFVLEILYLIF